VADYHRRLLDPVLTRLFGEVPAILLVGPRATGKTTTAMRHVANVVRLDLEAHAVAFRADPDAALASVDEPVLLDEWQAVPPILGAVKRAVDRDPRPGRFLLTGSVRADLGTETWAGTGRALRLSMFGMTVREQQGAVDGPPFLDRVADGQPLEAAASCPDLSGYVDLALRGGFPQAALDLAGEARQRWLDSYLDQLLTRDAVQVSPGRDPRRLGRYFEALSLETAGVTGDKTLFESAGINRKTAAAYEQLLQNLLVVEAVPAWTSNRIKRLVRSPKRYVVDPAFLGAALRLDVAGVLRDGDLLGRLLDTFVVLQLRAEIVACRTRPRLYHLRLEQGRHEVDLIAELGGGRIIGIEIKASAAPTGADAKHLAWLRDSIGERFTAGIVFHTGPRSFSLGERISAVPISSLWASAPS
jgi:hypothetical protein